MLKKTFITLICTMAVWTARAQQPDTARLYREINKLYEAYASGSLQYDFRYTYAGAHRPERILDSLSGSMETSATGTRMIVGNIEFITNPRYAIVLFREDKLMYLYKPNSVSSPDPLYQMRKLMETGLVSNVDMSKVDRNQRLSIVFDSTAGVKRIDMNIHASSGLLSSIRYLMRSEMIQDGRPLTDKELQKFGPLAMVNMYFMRYATLPADRAHVHESAYFTIENGDYKVTPAYNDYQIYKGSPNL